MATIRQFPLHQNLMGGVETTTPAHLISPTQEGFERFRQQHNWRLTPTLQQIPRKTAIGWNSTVTADVRFIGIVPGPTPGFGKITVLTPTGLFVFGPVSVQASLDVLGEGGEVVLGEGGVTSPVESENTYSLIPTAGTSGPLVDDGAYRRWATALYDGRLYYTNELNPLRVNNGAIDSSVSGGLAGRYLVFWYDHAVVGAPTGNPNRVALSDLYNFGANTPTATNEADYFDFVEWQQTDYPFTGVTGLGKLKGLLWVYTPTAIIPMRYVGLPKVFQVEEGGVITRNGNTFPWTLACLDTVHFYYDHSEGMFFVFDGAAAKPIGEPVRNYIRANLNEDIELARKMYSYIDFENREIWWPFVSQASAGPYDKAVVFNYRYQRWYTASVEDVMCFCGGGAKLSYTFNQLTDTFGSLAGTFGNLGLTNSLATRVYGSANGQILLEETIDTPVENLLPADDPILESGDMHYGDIRTIKENDAMVINATVNSGASIDVFVSGRDFLGDVPGPVYGQTANKVWAPTVQDGLVSYRSVKGRVLRYLFIARNSRLSSFHAFTDVQLTQKAEK